MEIATIVSKKLSYHIINKGAKNNKTVKNSSLEYCFECSIFEKKLKELEVIDRIFVSELIYLRMQFILVRRTFMFNMPRNY